MDAGNNERIVVEGKAKIVLASAEVRATGQLWPVMSGVLMEGAAHLARQALAIEHKYVDTTPPDAERKEHSACVYSGLFSAAHSIEAYANEVFLSDHPRKGSLFDARAQRVIDGSRDRFERLTALEKLQLALDLIGLDRFVQGEQPMQDAFTVIKMRNELTHFKPREIMAGERVDVEKRLAEVVRVGRVARGPFAPAEYPLLPFGLVGHSCLAWSINALLSMIESFATRAEIKGLRAEGWSLNVE